MEPGYYWSWYWPGVNTEWKGPYKSETKALLAARRAKKEYPRTCANFDRVDIICVTQSSCKKL